MEYKGREGGRGREGGGEEKTKGVSSSERKYENIVSLSVNSD